MSACAQVKNKSVDAETKCESPLTSCGGKCVDLDSSQEHCGECSNQCSGQCVMGDCQCQLGDVKCDNQCIDPQSNNEFCGASAPCELPAERGSDCGTSSQCNGGVCECQNGLQLCSGDCVDLMTDPDHCGNCDLPCAGVCSGGVCSTDDVFERDFTGGQNPSSQCTDFTAFRQSLGFGYTSVTMYGTFDTAGITCNEPAKADQIASALRTGTQFELTCNGHHWSYCDRLGGELWVDGPGLCDPSNCPNPGYIWRICWGSSLFGGVNTETCSPSVTQTMGLRFRR